MTKQTERWLTEAPYDRQRRQERRAGLKVRRCRWCGTTDLPKFRRTFCSDECVREFQIRRAATWVRHYVQQRDQGVCQQYGRDTFQLARVLRHAARSLHDWRLRGAMYRWLGFLQNQSLWEADHVVPVVEGGGLCGLEGYRTLCRPCHVRQTAQLRRRMAGSSPKPRSGAEGESL